MRHRVYGQRCFTRRYSFLQLIWIRTRMTSHKKALRSFYLIILAVLRSTELRQGLPTGRVGVWGSFCITLPI